MIKNLEHEFAMSNKDDFFFVPIPFIGFAKDYSGIHIIISWLFFAYTVKFDK